MKVDNAVVNAKATDMKFRKWALGLSSTAALAMLAFMAVPFGTIGANDWDLQVSQHVSDKARLFFNQKLRPSELAKSYTASGPYYGYGETRKYVPGTQSGRFKVDDEGFPLVRYGDGYHYNPVTLAQQALAEYSRKDGPSERFLRVADRLIAAQGGDGALRYDFPFLKYATGEMYQPGWVSGMAQGQALSVFARAYFLTGDDRYKIAGDAALTFMLRPFEEGGVLGNLEGLAKLGLVDKGSAEAPFIFEYPQTPAVYTLNGFMFSLQGLSDWADLTGSSIAKLAFEQNLNTLTKILPLYDLGSFTSYDLSFQTVPLGLSGKRRLPHINPAYHAVHIEQLWALHAVTGLDDLAITADRWHSYIGIYSQVKLSVRQFRYQIVKLFVD
jgi:heparosan-N-sulfate-glucuronate 5-epimerase